MPDANNILQISRLFGVTADYLLNDDYESDGDIPKIKAAREDNTRLILICLVTLEVMMLVLQFMCVMILQNLVFGILSFIPFIAAIGGFEYAHWKKGGQDENARRFRRKFYKISAWLGLYFPIRLLLKACAILYPRPYSAVALEIIIAAVYVAAAWGVNRGIDRIPAAEAK